MDLDNIEMAQAQARVVATAITAQLGTLPQGAREEILAEVTKAEGLYLITKQLREPIWAALMAMTEDNHSPQDQLSDEAMAIAGTLCTDITAELDAEAASGPSASVPDDVEFVALPEFNRGNILWTVGVTVNYGYAGSGRNGWYAEIGWHDGRIIEPGVIEGKIYTRHHEPTLAGALDAVMAQAVRFGILLGMGQDDALGFALFYEGDGDDPSYPPPAGWRAMLREEAARRGWRCIYKGD